MAKIFVEGIRLYGYHGCIKEESIIGANYVVDVLVEADVNKAAKSDKLEETIDYVKIYEIVKKEMAVRSKLIEHVAQRVLTSLKNRFPKTTLIEVKVTKLNPPIPGDVEKVSVVMCK